MILLLIQSHVEMLKLLLFGSKKDEVVVCKNACINPLNHFPAVWRSPGFFLFCLNQSDFSLRKGWLLPLLILFNGHVNGCVSGCRDSFFSLSPHWFSFKYKLRKQHCDNQKKMCLNWISIVTCLMLNLLQHMKVFFFLFFFLSVNAWHKL